VGNRLDSNQNGTSTFNDANQLEGDANFTYTYDNNGNLIQKTDTSTLESTVYEYDAENKLIRVASLDKAINYKYDGLGRRVEKEVTETAVTNVTQYIYDEDNILLEFDASNNITARYTHGPSIDEPLITERGGQSFFYHADGLGSITELTDTAGTVAQAYTYSSFGKIESQLDPTFVQPFTFTAREFGPETGLYFYRARYYDPSLGRFLHEDPIGFAGGGLNAFVYVDNNPTNWTDPLGLQARPTGPPPVPVPGATPDNGWKWNPDPRNSRGGSWGPQKPLPRQSQPSGTWDLEGHWDIDNGLGKRQRYNEQGRPISDHEAHRNRKPQNPQNYLDSLMGRSSPIT